MPNACKTAFTITIIPDDFQVMEVSKQLEIQSLPHIIPPVTIHVQPFLPCTPLAIFAAKKKYKPVVKKVQLVTAELPEQFCIQCNILGDPLKGLLLLSTNPPPFTPSGRYTLEQKAVIDKAHPDDFLWLEEWKLMHHLCAYSMKASPGTAKGLNAVQWYTKSATRASTPLFISCVLHLLLKAYGLSRLSFPLSFPFLSLV